jgi:hypothetical protein
MSLSWATCDITPLKEQTSGVFWFYQVHLRTWEATHFWDSTFWTRAIWAIFGIPCGPNRLLKFDTLRLWCTWLVDGCTMLYTSCMMWNIRIIIYIYTLYVRLLICKIMYVFFFVQPHLVQMPNFPEIRWGHRFFHRLDPWWTSAMT